MKDFKEYFEQNLPSVESFHPHFDEALSWILKAGGKYFRANLFLGVARELGAKKHELEALFPVALGIELLHAYSLIHDDLPAMDDSPLRRGVESVHTKFDETTAILVGDALNTEAFYRLSTANIGAKMRCKLIETLAKNAGASGMVLGQAIDCYFEGKKLNLKQLKFLHSKKTGALIAASVQMAAIATNTKHQRKFYELGLKLGLAFQINDDIIDATSSENEAGKPVANDVNKNSFVNLLGLEGAKQELEELRAKIIKNATKLGVGLVVVELIQTHLKG